MAKAANRIVSVIFSKSLEEAVVCEFVWHGHLYCWHDQDCVYYNETRGDESYMMECPEELAAA